MRFKKRFLLGAVILLIAGLLAVCFSPFAVSNGLRLWMAWKARHENLTVKIDKIEAPFLRPVVIQGFRVTSAPDAAFRIDISVTRATLSLNFSSMFLRTRGRAIQTLSAEGLHVELHRQHPGTTISERGWKTLQKILPANLVLDQLDLRWEDGRTVVLLRGVSLSAREIEAGRFTASQVMVSSPWLRQTFSNLRGATNWQDDRLIIAGLSLNRGLDLQSLKTDLSHLGSQHLGLDFDLDAFGGKIRASISNEWSAEHSNWNVAGYAAGISLAQTSEAFGLADHAEGLVHACQFTFRGDPRDPTHATASLWTELTGLKWRARAAETIMLGAAFYNRQIQLQQLYVKQSKNQLTLSGEAAFPSGAFDWFNPDFRGDISASIGSLGDFVSLFGANPKNFRGEIAINGTMNARDRKIGGHLTATGKSLSIFQVPVDALAARFNLKASEFEVEQLELHRGNDAARAQGKFDTAHDHDYSGKGTISVRNIGDYVALLPFSWSAALRQGTVNCDWSGSGKADAHSGTFHLSGHAISTTAPTELLPFDAELDAAYSPGGVFFRQLHLASERVSLNGFATFAPDYLQGQALALDLDGKPKLRGNIFLPIALSKLKATGSILEALNPEQKVDLDLAVESTDLAELSRALTGRADLSGLLDARFSIFGGLDSLQGWATTHLRDFTRKKDASRVSMEAEAKLTAGTANAKAKIQFRDSDPISMETAMPIRLGEQRQTTWSESFSAIFDFPKVSLARLPPYLSRDLLRDGILSGKLALSKTLGKPEILGTAQLTGGNFAGTLLKGAVISGRLAFQGRSAAVDNLHVTAGGADCAFSGKIDFEKGVPIIELVSPRPMFDFSPADAFSAAKCVSEIELRSTPGPSVTNAPFEKIDFSYDEKGKRWTGHLAHRSSGTASGEHTDKGQSFSFCAGDETEHTKLILASERPAKATRPRKKSRRR